MPIELTEEMTQALNDRSPGRPICIVATASKDGVPDIFFRPGVIVFDSEHLAYWERRGGESHVDMRDNAHVTVMYRDVQRRSAWRFYGRAELHEEGPVRREVQGRLSQHDSERDPERKGFAVLIRVDRVRLNGRVIMQREE